MDLIRASEEGADAFWRFPGFDSRKEG
jgi:hypothetical protein